MLALARERYQRWAWDRRDAVAALAFPGTWKLLARFPRAGLREFAYASSRQAYLSAARKYCPDLGLADLAEYSCGIRAQAVTRGGHMIHDFVFRQTARSVHVCNAPSPAATAAFPIADAVIARIKQ